MTNLIYHPKTLIEKIDNEIHVARRMDIQDYLITQAIKRRYNILTNCFFKNVIHYRGDKEAKYQQIAKKNNKLLDRKIARSLRRANPEIYEYGSVIAVDTGAIIDIQRQDGWEACAQFLSQINDRYLPLVTDKVNQEVNFHTKHMRIHKKPEINSLIQTQINLLSEIYQKWRKRVDNETNLDSLKHKAYWAVKQCKMEKENSIKERNDDISETDIGILTETIEYACGTPHRKFKKTTGKKCITGGIIITSDEHIEKLKQCIDEFPFRVPEKFQGEGFDPSLVSDLKHIHIINTRKL